MKILRNGTKNDENKTYMCECGLCGCVFEFTRKESKKEINEHAGTVIHYVECPQCGEIMLSKDWKEK